jgi:flavin-dependent dehydrogenase
VKEPASGAVFDAVIVGGGPAGSVCAARLARLGRRVMVLERERHPRFHLGESLLPGSVGVLEAVGVLDAVRERFIVKRGARFVDGSGARPPSRYAFAEAFHARWDHAFQVPRDAFDELLFRHAGICGAELREGWEATRVAGTGGGPGALLPSVVARDPSGALHTLTARMVVDATGRDALSARARGDLARLPALDRTALFTQVRGAWRDEGEREGDIQIVVVDAGAGQRQWFWLIPFADGRTSVGAVVSSAWMRGRRQRDVAAGAEGLFREAVRATPAVAEMLASAEYLFPPRATGDFSFAVRRIRGDGWIALGDAAGFIDPLFSTGAHLAMIGGLRAAEAIDEALSAGDVSAARFERWEATMRAGADLFLGTVQAFYDGELASYLFADPQHPFLRRAITSLLAGDVFDGDALWAREMRSRFPARM